MTLQFSIFCTTNNDAVYLFNVYLYPKQYQKLANSEQNIKTIHAPWKLISQKLLVTTKRKIINFDSFPEAGQLW